MQGIPISSASPASAPSHWDTRGLAAMPADEAAPGMAPSTYGIESGYQASQPQYGANSFPYVPNSSSTSIGTSSSYRPRSGDYTSAHRPSYVSEIPPPTSVPLQYSSSGGPAPRQAPLGTSLNSHDDYTAPAPWSQSQAPSLTASRNNSIYSLDGQMGSMAVGPGNGAGVEGHAPISSYGGAPSQPQQHRLLTHTIPNVHADRRFSLDDRRAPSARNGPSGASTPGRTWPWGASPSAAMTSSTGNGAAGAGPTPSSLPSAAPFHSRASYDYGSMGSRSLLPGSNGGNMGPHDSAWQSYDSSNLGSGSRGNPLGLDSNAPARMRAMSSSAGPSRGHPYATAYGGGRASSALMVTKRKVKKGATKRKAKAKGRLSTTPFCLEDLIPKNSFTTLEAQLRYRDTSRSTPAKRTTTALMISINERLGPSMILALEVAWSSTCPLTVTLHLNILFISPRTSINISNSSISSTITTHIRLQQAVLIRRSGVWAASAAPVATAALIQEAPPGPLPLGARAQPQCLGVPSQVRSHCTRLARALGNRVWRSRNRRSNYHDGVLEEDGRCCSCRCTSNLLVVSSPVIPLIIPRSIVHPIHERCPCVLDVGPRRKERWRRKGPENRQRLLLQTKDQCLLIFNIRYREHHRLRSVVGLCLTGCLPLAALSRTSLSPPCCPHTYPSCCAISLPSDLPYSLLLHGQSWSSTYTGVQA
ncbi:hypothetical protein BCV69DRAFT_177549 [Microstroma glucosiphilum]|uniref:Uncharacterized protein n=1 Tax=Pseudomicrostroma glucosiphilum TaxID=1684307 RepID=A0A316U6H5_9BASI|nr:hypothetical protein BCV69DRAFT_177549 [Pseudomicrostroma glucosiphilum]PWN20867.1 hypothetical protein BCV69DRAFT_177549 [Pseudomicrostroma glucosiphilum]